MYIKKPYITRNVLYRVAIFFELPEYNRGRLYTRLDSLAN